MRKNISLNVETVKRLDALYTQKGDSYEKIICRLLDASNTLDSLLMRYKTALDDIPPRD